MAQRATVIPDLATLVDDAISKGVVFECDDWENSSHVSIIIPDHFSESDSQKLKQYASQVRFLIRLRTLAGWLNKEYFQWLHNESSVEIDPDHYGKLIELFAGGDRMLRFTFDFEGCIWGSKLCNGVAPDNYAPFLCEGCANGK